jgi:hypothetical protein
MKSKILHSVVPTLLAVVFTDAQHADKTMASHPEATRIDERTVETRSDDLLELVH